jgi:hypothetical protein
LPTIGNRLSVAAGVALVAGMMAGTAWGAPGLLATGGDVTNVIGPIGGKYYGVHSFTNVGSSATFTPSQDLTVEYLVIGGGGGGGNHVGWGNGGGGAGGLITSVAGEYSGGGTAGVGSSPNAPASLTASTAYPVTVGTGGVAAANGGDSSFGSFATAVGGGRGNSGNLSAANPGGSGGGGGYSGGGGAGTAGQGWAGGSSGGADRGGGGGGAGNVGADADVVNAGNGGPGLTNSITGSGVAYAGGGGGYVPGAGTGGNGGGGNGNSPGTDGKGGGGGAYANGGSGIVIVRYEIIADLVPLLENVSVTNVTPTGAELKGHLTTNGTYTATVGVLWGENTNAWANTNWWSEAWADDSVKSTNITFSPSDLNKTLYFTCIATSPAGATVVSPPMSFISGEVTVQSTGTAKYPATPGLFTISRPEGCTNIAVTVTYTMGGTAVNGTDYVLLSGNVLMAAGESNKVVTVTPLPDLDDPETVTLTLGAGSGNYFYGSPPNNASLTIQKTDPPTTPYMAWGGDSNFTITVSGRPYAVHMYTNVGSGYFVPTKPIKNVEYLIIGGGGGGGNAGGGGGGGGGAGGYRSSVINELSGSNSNAEERITLANTDPVAVTIGAGGAGATVALTGGTAGSPSSFGSIVAKGGGGGNDGLTNGAGGGEAYPAWSAFGRGFGTAGQGFDGGYLFDRSDSEYGGGGGGGAGGKGGNGDPGGPGWRTAPGDNWGQGGLGLTNSITGTAILRGGGGCGARSARAGAGGGGGSGANGTDGTGGGGGGNTATGGRGGSGIVIVRYDISPPAGTLILLR